MPDRRRVPRRLIAPDQIRVAGELTRKIAVAFDEGRCLLSPADRGMQAGSCRCVVEAANPVKAVARNLPQRPKGRTVVIAVGKAAVPMAKAVEDIWDGPLEGLVIAPTATLTIWSGCASSMAAIPCRTRRALPPPIRHWRWPPRWGPTISDRAHFRRRLGADVETGSGHLHRGEVRAGESGAQVRRQHRRVELCSKAGLRRQGRPAGARGGPARIWTLALSDVPGDDPAIIGSGPTVPDPTRKKDALAILARYGVPVPQSIRRLVEEP